MFFVYDFFLTDLIHTDKNTPWTSFSNGCFAPLRGLLGGRTVIVVDGLIRSVQPDVDSYTMDGDLFWVRQLINVIGLIVAIPLGLIARLFSLMESDNLNLMFHLGNRDALKKTEEELIREGEFFPTDEGGWRGDLEIGGNRRGLLNEEGSIDRFFHFYGKLEKFAMDVSKQFLKEVRSPEEMENDTARKWQLLATSELFHFIIAVPHLHYSPLRFAYDSENTNAFFNYGSTEWRLREKYNKLVQNFERLIGGEPSLCPYKEDLVYNPDVISDCSGVYAANIHHFQHSPT